MTLKQVIESKKEKCRGCRNNFYNYGGNSTSGSCWSLDSMKMVYRWKINMWTPMDKRSNFVKVRVPHCYQGEGNHRDIFMARLPQHLGGDWADKAEQLRTEADEIERKDCVHP